MPSRRDFLKTSTIAIASAGAGSALTASAQNNVVVRQNIASLRPDDPILKAYRKGVEEMAKLPHSDSRSWYQQAKTHRTSCPHGNWFFLPWHREYLRWYESTIRELSGMDQFALPYWDWITDGQLPATFWDNELDPSSTKFDFMSMPMSDPDLKRSIDAYGNTRAIGKNELVGNPTDFSVNRLKSQVLEAQSVRDFYGLEAPGLRQGARGSTFFEGSLHGTVHGDIGGPMGWFWSPLDPIFWLHHANVDRIWDLWQQVNNFPAMPQTLSDFELSNMFFDPRSPGIVAPDINCGSLEKIEDLGYVYEAAPEQDPRLLNAVFGVQKNILNIPKAISSQTFEAKQTVSTSGTNHIGIDVSAPVGGFVESFEPGARAIADIDVEPFPEFTDAKFRIFVNCDYLNPSVEESDPHYVTTIAPFGLTKMEGHDGHDGDMVNTLKVDITSALKKISGKPGWNNGKLHVQLQPVPLVKGKSITSKATVRNVRVSLVIPVARVAR